MPLIIMMHCMILLLREQMREYRGTLTEVGKNSPNRDRSTEENLDLFARMRAGEFKEGEYTLRAKIDMSSPSSTVFAMPIITVLVINGVSIQCMTSHTVSLMH